MAGSGVTYRTADATVSAYGAIAITPSDTVNIAPTRAVYIGGPGSLKVDMAVDMGGTSTITLVSPAVGYPLPIQVTRIYATGTTATNIVAFY